jgi:acetylglutamate kinase
MAKYPPSTEDMIRLAEAALAAIPPLLAVHVRGCAILVEDMPDEGVLKEMDIDDPWSLTGLYMPAGEIAHHPTTVLLYRLPILLEWIETDVELGRLVRNVVIHEIAHHFGFNDADIAALEAE